MGKQSKTKRTKGSKLKKIDDEQNEQNIYKINPEIIKDVTFKDCFRFWNGDAYVGEFALDVEGNIYRQGKGAYFSSDGHIFNGQWQDDKLVVAEKISNPDGSWYRGPLEDGRYSGVGTFTVPTLGSLEGCFVEGRPQGLVTLTDLDGCQDCHGKWQGQAGSDCVTLLPRNHFYDSEDTISKRLKVETISKLIASKMSSTNTEIKL